MIGPASNKVIEEGEIVQIGCSPSFEGYKGVCRRSFVMGKRSELQKAYFDCMNEAYRKGGTGNLSCLPGESSFQPH
ncbi:MAG: hypothetical protein ACLTW9_23910 [Enterocloster sp.]